MPAESLSAALTQLAAANDALESVLARLASAAPSEEVLARSIAAAMAQAGGLLPLARDDGAAKRRGTADGAAGGFDSDVAPRSQKVEAFDPRQLAQAIREGLHPATTEREQDQLARDQVDALRKIDQNTQSLQQLSSWLTWQ